MAEQRSRPRGRLAVINDDTAFLQLMHDLLEEEEHFEVLIHREWDNAYEFVKEQRPDLLILDIRIGGEEHGWTILNLLTLDPATRPIPVIVCSRPRPPGAGRATLTAGTPVADTLTRL